MRLSTANPEMVFTHVMHHFDEDSLLACFHELNGKKAHGFDGIDKLNSICFAGDKISKSKIYYKLSNP